MRIRINKGQSIWDIAVQFYGSASGVSQLLLDNPGIANLNDNLPPGTMLSLDQTAVINTTVVEYLKKNGFRPTTTVYVAIGGPLMLEDGTELILENEDNITLE